VNSFLTHYFTLFLGKLSEPLNPTVITGSSIEALSECFCVRFPPAADFSLPDLGVVIFVLGNVQQDCHAFLEAMPYPTNYSEVKRRWKANGSCHSGFRVTSWEQISRTEILKLNEGLPAVRGAV